MRIFIIIMIFFININANEFCDILVKKYVKDYDFIDKFKDKCKAINEIYLSLDNKEKYKINEIYLKHCNDKNYKYCDYLKQLYLNSLITDKNIYFRALELGCYDNNSCFDIVYALINENSKNQEYFYKLLENKCNEDSRFCYVFINYKYKTNDDLMCEKNPSTCYELAVNKDEIKKAKYLRRACGNNINEACMLIKDYKKACDNKYAKACEILAKEFKDKKDYKALKYYMKLACKYGGSCYSYDFNQDNMLNIYKDECDITKLNSCKKYIENTTNLNKDFYNNYSKIYENLCLNSNIMFCKDAVMIEYKMKNYKRAKYFIDYICLKNNDLCKELSINYLKDIYKEEL
ncbi:hypothetical protein [Campylobacter sp. RM12651]|uniref:hypothetical protein n=1 Tax=Campylobacter sp. RM12651 TaxID=1660079 RepID=UPI001EFA6260|nr:hypothetical protein [Campylobacter sp. RM12651]ULO03552.1 hypothetical protein AVBRAN_1094 [Campylobacter sp. RM12651]